VTESAARWDPAQYLRYADERSRPFVELLARVRATAPAVVVDLGCGPGTLTATLAQRWPAARIIGVDNSAEMIEAAATYAHPAGDEGGSVEFHCADVREFRPDGSVDVVVANALLQWVPDHLTMLSDIASWLVPGGELAFQVPDNFAAPSHVTVRDLRLSAEWHDRLGAAADRGAAVATPEEYLTTLAEAGLDADVWTTTYLHILHGDDPVLEWIKGTALRPVLTALADDPDATERFLRQCAGKLREAYPPQPYGTVFPFRRTFAIGQARMSS
jgi:trans-aconitate 2-methyltransferase